MKNSSTCICTTGNCHNSTSSCTQRHPRLRQRRRESSAARLPYNLLLPARGARGSSKTQKQSDSL